MNSNLQNHEDKREAREARVALESTIYAFGLPYPENKRLAHTLENAVKESGATPYTMGILHGDMHFGLDDDALDLISRAQMPKPQGTDVVKLNASDLGLAMAKKMNGATTVSATCAMAAQAGIRVFATGGIGGVHREAETTFDESQDLTAMAKYPVAVISAGAKAILDLPKTLERLETLGVPVIGFGTDVFPAFYTRTASIKQPLKLSWRADSVEELALMLHHHWKIHPQLGVLVANPIPEQYALPQEQADAAVEQALQEAAQAGVRGKAVTPWLLARLEGITGGASVAANLALIENNARLAGQLAVALAHLQSL